MSGSTRTDVAQRNRRTAITAFAVVAGMVGLSFAFVPLYQLICQVTGLGGTPKLVEDVNRVVVEEKIEVRFDANVDRKLPWEFGPVDKTVTVKFGEDRLAYYRATNTSDVPVTGISTFNVSPLKAAQYFTKIECFCFIEQTLQPGESVEMPVTFYVDPALLEDDLANDVKSITLSYTFYRSLDDVEDEETVSQRNGEDALTLSSVQSDTF